MTAERILAIDPGSRQSAWLMLTDGLPTGFAIWPNEQILTMLRPASDDDRRPDVVVIEQIESFGMAVGREVFETVHWAGRFFEAAHPLDVRQLTRRVVKVHLCGTSRAKDANIRAALMDRFGGASAKGTKKNPGPLFGISADVWAALAVALTFAETNG